MKVTGSGDLEPLRANMGRGPSLSVIDIGQRQSVAVVEADTAFWALVDHEALADCLAGDFVSQVAARLPEMTAEMEQLRFGLRPSAVYFNPTDRCNFNCSYCYLPESLRRNGEQMTPSRLVDGLEILSAFFASIHGPQFRPQLIFHGSEPMLAREAVFEAIKAFSHVFDFGLQTNASLLEDRDLAFLTEHQVAIGISLDGPDRQAADATRHNWEKRGFFNQVVKVIDSLAGYDRFNVITTVTTANVQQLPKMVEFYHEHGVQTVMLNPVRCTRHEARNLKPADDILAHHFMAALERSYQLYQESGRKLVVSNFANILASILGPTSRRLMCDISPCGGGRCFFAVAANGDVFPCSEFIGLSDFRGGNLYSDDLEGILASPPFKAVTSRVVEKITPCRSCAIRHFCGAPCPAEVAALSGSLETPAPFCSFYQHQACYALRLIAEKRHHAFLWDDWNQGVEASLDLSR